MGPPHICQVPLEVILMSLKGNLLCSALALGAGVLVASTLAMPASARVVVGFGFGVPLALGYLVVVPLERWLEPPPINRATCERVLARWQYDHGHNPFESCVQLKNGGWCVYNDQDEGRCILP